MITISNLFVDTDEQIIEDITVCCINKYGESFLEDVLRFLDTDNITEIDNYFDREFSIVWEGISKSDKFSGSEQVQIEKDLKDAADMGTDQERRWGGKRHSEIRKLTHRMSKNKVGRAIVKGVRRIAYGTKLGRKIVRKHAEKIKDQAGIHANKAIRHGKAATRLAFLNKKLQRDGSSNSKVSTKSYSVAKKAGSEAAKSRKMDRAALQLQRNARMVEKKQAAKKAAKQSSKLKFAHV